MPLWIPINPFYCYFCKKLNEYQIYDFFEDEMVNEKLPIYENCSYNCKFCKTPNIVIDPKDYSIMKICDKIKNMTFISLNT